MSSARHAAGQNRPQGNGTSLMAVIRTISRLAPKQLNDELALAKSELKRKGIAAGIAAAFLVVALVFFFFLLTALIVAAVMGLATIMPAWLAALIVAAAFLVLMAIIGLIGYLKIKKVMPLKPELALTGLRHDLEVAKTGHALAPGALSAERPSEAEIKARQAAKKAAAEKAKAEREAKAAQKGPAPSEAELRQRTADRRHHLLNLRSQLLAKADMRSRVRSLLGKAQDTASHVGGSASEASGEVLDTARERWLPLSVLAVSATAALVLLRRLLRS
ncbi:MAG: phage holin family protein [Actinomycetales bacterium]